MGSDSQKSAINEIGFIEAVEKSAKAADEHEVCPECGEEFEGTDMSRGGSLVYIHEAGDMCSVETEVDRVV